MRRDSLERVLSIYATAWGYAIVLFENRDVIDWGVKRATVRSRERNARSIAKLSIYIERYQPDMIVIEDYKERTSRRAQRIRALYRSIAHLAHTRGIGLRLVSRKDIVAVFDSVGATNRYEIAQAVAHHYSLLAHRLPKKPRLWENERRAMGVFYAAALAITYFASRGELGPAEGSALDGVA
jgi:hypothetical protein